MQNCKLKPEADEVLHAIIGRLGEGVEVIGGHAAETKPEEGVVHLAQTLDDYAAHFDHRAGKGWRRDTDSTAAAEDGLVTDLPRA